MNPAIYRRLLVKYSVLASVLFLILYAASSGQRSSPPHSHRDASVSEAKSVTEANINGEHGAEYVLNASASIQPKIHSVAIFSYILDADEYDLAIESVACYAILHNYTYLLIFENDYWLQKCPQGHIYFRRHCVLQYFLDQYDYILVIDADIGVVNPHREIEEWIDPNFDLIFYERLFSKEVSTASFIIRKSNFSTLFLNTLLKYSEKGFGGKLSGDNAAIHVVFVELFAPYAKDELEKCLHIWEHVTTYPQLFAFEACLWLILGKRREFGQNAKILERGRAWVRDAFMTNSRWSFGRDFMFHNWKARYMRSNDNATAFLPPNGEQSDWINPFSRPLNQLRCVEGKSVYYWKAALIGIDREIEKNMADLEREARRQFHEYVVQINQFIPS